VTAASATISTAVNPNNLSTVAWVLYGASGGTSGYGNISAASLPFSSGSALVPQEIQLTGLQPNTTYYYAIVASNQVGAVTNSGSDLSFTTSPEAPGVTASSATLSGISAQLGAAVDAYGSVTAWYFDYSAQGSGVTNYLATNTISGSQGSISVTGAAGPLPPNTCFNWQLVAISQGGTTVVNGTPFCTSSQEPAVTTGQAAGLTSTSALLQGQVNPNGVAGQGYFLWGATPGSVNNSTAPVSTGSGLIPTSINTPLTGLHPNTFYYFRAVGVNSQGTQYGSIQSFITPSLPVQIQPPPGTYVVSNTQTRGATAYAIVTNTSGGLATAILTDGGQGYTSAPNVTVVPTGAGAGASVTATLQNGSVYSLTIQNTGGGYDVGGVTLVIDPPPNEIQAAANNPAYDTIVIPQGFVTGNTVFSRNVSVVGQGAAFTTVSGNGAGSVFQVNSGATVLLENMTITGGAATNGGGIFNNGGSVIVEACNIVSNSAAQFGGGVYNNGNAVLTINDSQIIGNAAGLAGAGLCGDGLQTTRIPNVTNALGTVSDMVGDFYGGLQNFYYWGVSVVTQAYTEPQYVLPDLIDNVARQITSANVSEWGTDAGNALEEFGSSFDNLIQGAVSNIDNLDAPSKIQSGMSNPFASGANGGDSGWFQLGASICTVSNCAIANNQVNALASGFSAGVHNQLGLMQIINSKITGNVITSDLVSYGGGLGNLIGAIDLEGCVVSNNTASSTTVLAGGGGAINIGGLIRATNTSWNNNNASAKFFSSGGGIYNTGNSWLALADCQLNNNTSTGGGALDNDLSGTAYVTNCTMVSNVVDGIVSSYGAAVRNRSLGAVTLVGCTIASNSAVAGSLVIPNPEQVQECIYDNLLFPNSCDFSTLQTIAIPLDSRGGAFYNGSASDALASTSVGIATLALSSCTIAGNTSTGSSSIGGGIYITCTSSYNPLFFGETVLDIDNTLVAFNTGGGQIEDFKGDGGAGTQTNNYGYNLDSDGSVVAIPLGLPFQQTSITQTNWELGPLANNGGPTATMALLPGSMALTNGSKLQPGSGTGAPQPTDQRGITRPQFGRADIGAFENSEPQVSSSSFIDFENQPLQISAPGVLSNSFGAEIAVEMVAMPPTNGQLTLNADGSFVYQPASNYFGPDSFAFQAKDTFNNTAQGSVSITILPVLQFAADSIGTNIDAVAPGAFSLDFGSGVDSSANENAVIVRGSESVTLPATVSGSGTNLTVTPEASFHPGELVTVELLKSLVATNGGALNQPRLFQYVTAASGSALFPSSTNFGTAQDVSIALADLDGNGSIDAYVASKSRDEVYLNDGHGNFTLAQTLPGNSTGVALGDLNGDGFPDVVVTKAGGLVGSPNPNVPNGGVPTDYNRIYFNDETGHFQPSSVPLVPGTFTDLDTLAAPGTLTAQQIEQLSVTINQCSSGVAIGDLNNDGSLDVVLINNSTLGFFGEPVATPGNSVWYNDGQGGMVRGPTLGSVPAYSVALADVNGDGWLDIIVGALNGIEIWLNNGPRGGFTQAPTLQNRNNNHSYIVPSLAVGDVNGDGAVDIVSAISELTAGSNPAYGDQVWLNNGHGGFSQGQFFVGNVAANALALGDLNGDGKLDIVATGFFGVEVWTNNGSGTFAPNAQPFKTAYIGEALALADLDGDGNIDLFTLNIPGSTGISTNADFVFFNDTPPTVPSLDYTVTEGSSLSVSAPGLLADVYGGEPGRPLSIQLSEPFVYVADTLGDLFFEIQGIGKFNAANLGETPQGQSTYTNVTVLYAQHGSLSVHSDGSFTYMPNPYFYGVDTFPLVVSDGLLTGSNIVTITVTQVIQPPLMQDSYYPYSGGALTENAAQGVLSGDVDQNGLALTASLLQPPSHGSVSLNSDGSFTYTPAAGFAGADVFTYEATDGEASNSASAKIGNTPPVGVPDFYPMPGNGFLSVGALNGVLANDNDPDGDVITAVLLSAPAHGQLTLNSNGSFVYTRFTNYSGDDSFTYQASDGIAFSSSTLVRLGDATPVANNDIYTTPTNQTLTVIPVQGVLNNDIDPDGYPLSALLVSSTTHGALTFNMNGSFTYLPNPGYIGLDSFSYYDTDGVSTSAIATATIAVSSSSIAVTGVSPTAMGPTNVNIQIQFNAAISPTLAGVRLHLYGSQTGAHSWTGYGSSNVMFATPQPPFRPGEQVTASLAPGLQGYDGTALGSGYVWNFYISAPRGSGIFTQSSNLVGTNPAAFFWNPIVGDFDGDGLLDVMLIGFDDSIDTDPTYYNQNLFHFLHNNGNRTFTDTRIDFPAYHTTFNYPEAAIAGDFQGNGKLELLTVTGLETPFSLQLWNFLGTNFSTVAFNPDPNTLGGTLDFLGVGDFNGDGSLDVIGFNANSTGNGGVIWVMTNDGAGNLHLGPTTQVSDSLTQPSFLTILAGVGNFSYYISGGAIADVNGDGQLDLALIGNTGCDLWTNDGTGHFAQQPQLSDVSGTEPQVINTDIQLADFNGDGTPDALILGEVGTTNTGTYTIRFQMDLFTDVGGDFTALFGTNLFGLGNYPATGAVGDLTGQGKLDVVYAGVTTLVAAFNNGPGQFSLNGISGTATNTAVALADFDGDGALDIFITGTSSGGYSEATTLWNSMIPLAKNDLYPAGTLSVNASAGVLTNDLPGSGGPISAVLVTQPTNATVTLQSDGAFTVTPGAGFAGVTSFTYEAVDTNGASYPAQLRIGDAPPVAGNCGPYLVFNSAMLNVSAAAGVLSNAFSPQGSPPSAILLSQPTNGILNFSSNGAFTYTAFPGYIGPDSFNFIVSDGISNSAVATAFLLVSAPLNVVSVTPAMNALAVVDNPTLTVTFNRPLDPASISGNISIFGSKAAAHTYAATVASNVLTMVPNSFGEGAIATVSLGAGLHGMDGEKMTAPFVWQFTIDAPIGRGHMVDSGQRLNVASLTNSVAIALADVNGDGALDAIIVHSEAYNPALPGFVPTTGYTMIWTNNGKGQFADSGQRLTSPGIQGGCVASADVNGDGWMDLAVSGDGCPVQLWTNDHTGHFNLAANQPPASGWTAMAFADINGDGHPDLIGATPGSIQILTNDGAGNFSMDQTINGPTCFCVGDVNLDGTLDIVAGYESTPESGLNVVTYTNDGYGAFFESGLGISTISANDVAAVALADLNGDGYEDLVVTGTTGTRNGAATTGTLTEVWLNDHHGNFTNTGQEISTTNVPYQSAIRIADLDGNGTLDVLVLGFNPFASISPIVYFNNGTGNITGRTLTLPLLVIPDAAIDDLNGDGSPDIFFAVYQGPSEVFTNGLAIGDIEGAAQIQTTDHTNVAPFATIVLPGSSTASVSATVTASTSANGSFTPASLTASGFLQSGNVYTLTGTTLSGAQTALADLVFIPKIHNTPVGQTETVDFTILISDGTISRTNSMSSVTAVALNDPPVAANYSAAVFNTMANKPFITGNVLASDTDPNPGDTLSVFSLPTGSTVGSVSNVGNGTISYNPNSKFNWLPPGQTASDQFSYVVTDPHGALATGMVSMVITGVLNPPTVPNAAISVGLHSPPVDVTAQLLLNASAAVASNTPSLTISAIQTTGTKGQVTLANGHVTYYTANAFGYLAAVATASDSFAFTVKDALNATATANVTIIGQDDAPTAGNVFLTLLSDATPTNLTALVITNDFDPDANTNTDLTMVNISLVSTKGVVTLTNGVLYYQPGSQFLSLDEGSNAVDSFKYTVQNTNGLTAQGTITVTNVGVNFPPLAPVMTFVDGEGQTINLTAPILSVASDPNTGETATLQITGINAASASGIVLLNSGVLTYEPSPLLNLTLDETNFDTFSYIISDIHGATATGMVTMIITGQPVPPNATSASVIVSAAAPSVKLTASLLKNDTDPNPLDTSRLFLSGFYTNGTVGTVSMTNTDLYYSPDGKFNSLAPGAIAPDAFAYVVSDPFGDVASAAVNVTVVGPPVISRVSLNGGQLLLQFVGLSNTVCTVEASANLVNWTVIGHATETSPGNFRYTNIIPGGVLDRYYQAAQTPTNLPSQ
jgi:VCBS repeat-containing protein